MTILTRPIQVKGCWIIAEEVLVIVQRGKKSLRESMNVTIVGPQAQAQCLIGTGTLIFPTKMSITPEHRLLITGQC